MKTTPLVAILAACTLSAVSISQQKQSADSKKATTSKTDSNGDSKQRRLQIQYDELVVDETKFTRDFKIATVTDTDEGTVFKSDDLHVIDKPQDGSKPTPETQIATATGNMSVDDKQAHIVGGKAVIYFAKSKRLVVVTDNVVIEVKPKSEEPVKDTKPGTVSSDSSGKKTDTDPKSISETDDGPKSARKYPSKITCDKVEYEYSRLKKHAVLTGHFKIVQTLKDKVRTLTAEHAEWFGLDEKVKLYPPVHVEDTKGMKADSDYEVDVFTKEGEEKLNMKRGKGEILFDDDDEPEQKLGAPLPATSRPPVKVPPQNPTTTRPDGVKPEKKDG